jgi:endonuclease/exonuclease/phosphatase family metal-dependent hydrolase
MHLLTWNVAGLHERRLDERTELQCLTALLRERPFDVIALQEVVRRSWHAHWRHHLAAAGYRVLPEDPTRTDSSYFSVLAVRGEARGGAIPFPTSRMGRALVWAEVGSWLVLTSHLESERQGRGERLRQADDVLERLVAWPGPAVFAGDTNLRVEEEPDLPRLGAVTDAWDAVGRPPEARATWRGGRTGARFDRIWAVRARPEALEVVGAGAVVDLDGLPLSDHVGLALTLSATA